MAFLSSSPPTTASSRTKRWSPDDDNLFEGGNVDITVRSQYKLSLQPSSSPPGSCKPSIRPLHLQSGTVANSAQQPLSPSLGMTFEQSMFISAKADQINIGGSSQSSALASKDTNCLPHPVLDVHSKPIAKLPFKRPAAMLFNRTSSASAILQPEDPFKVSPRNPVILPSTKTASGVRAIRPKQLFQRSQSDNAATLSNDHGRRPAYTGSSLSREIIRHSSPQKQHTASAAQANVGDATQRRISGSARLKAAIQALPQHKPQLLHTSSAPITHPQVRDIFGAMPQRSSEPSVPTRNSLLSYHAHQAMELSSSSPDKMDVDDDHDSIPSSSPAKSIASSVAGQIQLAMSPGLGDLFADNNGLDRCQLVDSSPAGPIHRPHQAAAAQIQAGRKRVADEAESSFASSAGPSSPSATLVATQSRGSRLNVRTSGLPGEGQSHLSRDVLGPLSAVNADSYGRAAARRPIYRTTSSNSISNKRRNSGQAHSASAACSQEPALSAAYDKLRHAPNDGSLSRPPTRPGFTKRNPIARSYTEAPTNASRRTQSMCDSEFYASPPLSIAAMPGAAAQQDYFSGANTALGSKRQTVAATVVPQCGNDALKTSTSSFETREETGKVLPCFHVPQDRLMRITPATLVNLLDGEYDSQVDHFVVIDCRFEYEFLGGAIEGAISLNNEDAMDKFIFQFHENSLFRTRELMPPPSSSAKPGPGRTVLVFHCEFSAMRAPKLAGWVRSKDRAMNHDVYPAVHFPEIYILHGGYAAYYKDFPAKCKGYVQMDDPKYATVRAFELGVFRRTKDRLSMGSRSQSYTDGVFKKDSDAAQVILKQPNAAHRAASAPYASQRTSARYNGVVESSGVLGVHHEEQEGLDSGTGECGSPDAGSVSRKHRGFGMLDAGNGQSSPSGMDTSGEIASPSAPIKCPMRPPFLKTMLEKNGGHANTFPLRLASRDRIQHIQADSDASVFA